MLPFGEANDVTTMNRFSYFIPYRQVYAACLISHFKLVRRVAVFGGLAWTCGDNTQFHTRCYLMHPNMCPQARSLSAIFPISYSCSYIVPTRLNEIIMMSTVHCGDLITRESEP